MNLGQLRYAQAIAETGSFRKAAEICFATQPTLSNAIASLEDELGGRLFARTTRKVSMTPFGDHMLPLIIDILSGREELVKAAESYLNPEHQLLRIGLSPLIDAKFLNQMLEPYRNARPDVSIFFKECFLDDISERLNKEQLDIAVVPLRQKNLNLRSQVCYTDPLYYIPQQLHASNEKPVSLRTSELPDAPIILTGGGCGLNDLVRELFNKQNVQLNEYTGHATSYKTIEEWASLGIGASILPKRKLSNDNNDAVPLLQNNGKAATFTYEWLWNQVASKKAHVKEFIDYIANTVPALVAGGEGRR